MAESTASTPGLAGVAELISVALGVIVTGQGIEGHLPVATGGA